MAYLDVAYTNGVIAAREKHFFKEKLFRLAEGTAEEALCALLDGGFGCGEHITSVSGYEKLVLAEENSLDAFIREYAPSEAEEAFFLLPRDFHNAKALVKARLLQTDANKMLCSEGRISVAELRACIERGSFATLEKRAPFLGETIAYALQLPSESVTGGAIGAAFERATYRSLYALTKGNGRLIDLLQAKADRTNILTALRADDEESAEEYYLPFGKVTKKQLSALFDADIETRERAFKGTSYETFVKLALEEKNKGLPMREAEKELAEYEISYFAARAIEWKQSAPFLYYVFRKKAECSNVRILFACLLAGRKENEIKRRLRRIV